MSMAAPQALVGGWGPGPPRNFGHGPSLLGNFYIKKQQKLRVNPPPPP